MAVKVLPSEFAADPERLARFAQEAAGALNQAVDDTAQYDVSADGQRFVVNVVDGSQGPAVTVDVNWTAVLGKH